MAKVPADQRLLDLNLADSRTKAQALIMAAAVWVGDRPVRKPGELLPADCVPVLRDAPHPWVSRGGIKLAAALDHFAIDPAGVVALDVGASTGGFTDVLLSAGAARVYAVDVGHGQLAWTLRTDPRVVVLERTNARHLTREQVPEPIDLVVCDASFIGLETVLPAPLSLTRPGARLVALIKPQFEAGRGQVGKGGVVRDPAVREAARRRICDWLTRTMGWQVEGWCDSPIAGPRGNREILVAAVRPKVGGDGSAIPPNQSGFGL